MKKLKMFLLSLFVGFIFPGLVFASSGKITISGGGTTVIGNKVTVTVKLSAGASWEMNLNYDKEYLQLISAGGEAGGTKMVNTSTGKPNRTYTFTFKTLKKGSTTIKIGSYYIVDDNFETMTISAGSKTIKIITQEELEASYSKDNNLKSLEIDGYEISPTFSKDVLDYTVNVPEGTTSINVKASPNDNKASVSGDGEISVTEGINNLKVVVKAENGSEKTYNLIVNVIDQNPIIVPVDDINYTVIKLRSNYTCPELFTESEVMINDTLVPACFNEKINYTLIGLKKEDGSTNHFVYENGLYTKYQEITGTSLKVIPITYQDTIVGLEESLVTINEEEYQAFKFSSSSRFYVFYGLNVETGEKDFYSYDSKNNTFSLYNTEYIDYLKGLNKTYVYVIIAFGFSLLLSLVCIIYLCRSRKKLKKKQNKDKSIDGKEDINAVKEINLSDNEDSYEIIDNQKKKKKR